MKHHWKCLGKKSEHSCLLLYSQGFWIHVYCILFCLPLWPWFSSPSQGFHRLHHRQAPAPKRSVCTFLIRSYAEGYIEKINPGNYQLNSTEHNNQKKKSPFVGIILLFPGERCHFPLDYQDNCIIFSTLLCQWPKCYPELWLLCLVFCSSKLCFKCFFPLLPFLCYL